MNPNPYNNKTLEARGNVVFAALGFFFANWIVILPLMLVNVLIIIIFKHLTSSASQTNFLNAITSGTKNVQEIVNSLSLWGITGMLLFSFVSVIVVVAFAVMIKVMISALKSCNDNKLIYRINNYKLPYKPKEIFDTMFGVYFRKEIFKVSIKVVLITLAYVFIAFVSSLALVIILGSFVPSFVISTIFFIFIFILLVTPPLVASLVVFDYDGNFKSYSADIKQLFGKYGADIFNFFVFVSIIRISTSTVFIVLVSIINTLLGYISTGLADFVNSNLLYVISGFMDYITVLVALFVVAFYHDGRTAEFNNNQNKLK